jgi:hypothetical protein
MAADFITSPLQYALQVVQHVEHGEWGDYGDKTPAYALAKPLVEATESLADIHRLVEQILFTHLLDGDAYAEMQAIEREINKTRKRLEEPK